MRPQADALVNRAWLLVALLCLLCVTQTARAADDTIYGVNFNSPARVMTITPSTGVAVPVGTLSFGSATAALDPISGNIFYTEYNPFGTSQGRVAYWNPTTLTNTIINSTGPGFQIPRLAFNSTGTLYGMDANNILYTIDTDDGEFHQVGTVSGVTPVSGGDLAFSPNGTLYLLAGGTLYTIDLFSLSASSVLNTGISNPTGLTFADNSILYASDLAANANMYTIDLSTGVTTPTSSTAGTYVDDLTSLPKFANLSITKAASSSFVVGTTATYTLTVSNAGPQSASATIRVRDTLPTGLTYNTFNAPGWACSAAGQVVTCDRATTLGIGASSTITLTVNVLAAASPSVTNTATVDSPTFDQNTANNSSTVTTAVTVPPDLTITKTHAGNFTQGQNGATYTITVTNAAGSGPTANMITVTDTLPAGLSFVSGTGTNWNNCTASGQVVTCTRNVALAAGASSAITLTVNVDSNAPASVTNTASVAVSGEVNTGNNSASNPTTINGRPDLTVAKSHTGNFTQGQSNAPYTITVTNAGGAVTTAAITVTDTLPAGLTFVSGSGTNWNACTAVGQVVTCTRTAANTIAALGSTTINLLVNVSATAPASVTNSVSVSGGGETNVSNNSATDPTTINQLADLTIAKSHTGNFTQGQNGATYTITVTNSGNGTTSATVTVTDTLPAGLTFVSGSGTGWNNCTASGQVVTCIRPAANTIAANTSTTINLLVNVAANAPASVTNSVAVSGGGEIIVNNNSATDPTTINPVADLIIAKSHTGNFTQGQNGATYTITVTNSGVGATTSTVTVTDTLPAGLSFVSGGGTGWNACTASGQVVTCQNLNTLNPGVSYQPLTITVNVAANAPFNVTNSVAVSGGGELNTGNDTASDATTINGVPDLTIAKTHTGNFTQGQNGATYTITVTNSGTAQTNGSAVTVTDTLPAGLTFVSGSPAWGCSASGQVVTCTNSSVVNAGNSFPALTLTVNVSATASASVTNSVSVSGGGESNTGNNSASDVTTINPVADLTIAKTHAGNFRRGSSGTYNITVTNSGAAQTSGSYTVTDTLPAGLTPTGWSGAGAGWGCSIVSQTVTCTNSNTLNAGASNSALSINVSVAQNAASSVTNTVSVSGGGEANTSNDTASDPTTIVSSSDLSLTKVTSSSGAGIGTNATFTITLTNSGPTDATNVAVRDQLPAGLTYVSSTPSVGAYNSGTGVWTVAALASGASATLQIVARIDALGSITNTAQVTASDQPDPDSTPNNNNAAEDDQASSSLSTLPPSVALCKTFLGQPCPPPVTPPSLPPGSDITYIITFTNSGGSPATTFIVTDPFIPAGPLCSGTKLNDYTYFKVGSVSNTLPTGLSLGPLEPKYSNDCGATWNYTPTSGAGGAPAGYDANVTHIRWNFTGSLSQIGPNNTGNVSFTVRIK